MSTLRDLEGNVVSTPNPTQSVADHVADADPHPTYLTAAEGNAAYKPLSAPSLAVSIIGKNAIGASWETIPTQRVYMKRFVLSAAALIATLEAYLQNDGTGAAGNILGLLYEETGTNTYRLRSFSTEGSNSIGPDLNSTNIVGRWVALPWAPIYVPAGTYHLGWYTNANTPHLQVAYDAGSDGYHTSGVTDKLAALTNSTRDYSVRAAILQ